MIEREAPAFRHGECHNHGTTRLERRRTMTLICERMRRCKNSWMDIWLSRKS
jgi:hypothetical protein